MSDFSTKLPVGLFGLIKTNNLVLSVINDKIFSTEHGPQGGDEINLIKEKGNYGWPLESYGTRYGDGESFNKMKTSFKNKSIFYLLFLQISVETVFFLKRL